MNTYYLIEEQERCLSDQKEWVWEEGRCDFKSSNVQLTNPITDKNLILFAATKTDTEVIRDGDRTSLYTGAAFGLSALNVGAISVSACRSKMI